jgi:hypothetical protein
MRISHWGATAIAALGLAAAGCAGDKFSACDNCDAGAGTSGNGGTDGMGGSAGAAGATGGASGSSGASGSGGSAGTRDAGGGSGGSAGSAGAAGSAGTAGSQNERFPRTTVLDDFNRANGPPGSNWTGNVASYAVSDQRLAFVSGAGHAALWQSLFGAEQEVFATLASIDPDAGEINVVLKAQEYADCELLEVLYSPSEQRLELTYCRAGIWHSIDGIPLTLQRGDQLGARFYANNNVHVFVNGVRAAIFDASEYPYADRGGRIGVNCEANPDGTTAWDDFGGG